MPYFFGQKEEDGDGEEFLFWLRLSLWCGVVWLLMFLMFGYRGFDGRVAEFVTVGLDSVVCKATNEASLSVV